MRNFVFGDTGGHGNQLLSSLFAIGLDKESLKLPEDVRIIHLGDLIHKGPDSNVLVHFVNEIMAANPGQWIQLFGNHELHHVPDAPKFWRCDCDLHTITMLNGWLDSGKARITWGLDEFSEIPRKEADGGKISTRTKGIFFSHAGLTRMFWKEVGALASAEKTAEAINALPLVDAARPGVMLFDPFAPKDRIQRPGPAWALGHSEVFESWTDTELPFSQVHGHTTAFSWPHNAWYEGVTKVYRDATVLYPIIRASVTDVDGNVLIGVDPGFDKTVDLDKQPYLTIIS